MLGDCLFCICSKFESAFWREGAVQGDPPHLWTHRAFVSQSSSALGYPATENAANNAPQALSSAQFDQYGSRRPPRFAVRQCKKRNFGYSFKIG
jgi:hypothetical protein